MDTTPQPVLLAKGSHDLYFLPKMANRHGLIAGATGTGKTVTLQRLAESFSKLGVPVFMADVKGDLSGISQAGAAKPKIMERVQQLGLSDWQFSACPVTYWDIFGEQGHPMRATVSDMGPLLLSRLLDLNETQSGVLSLTFKVADDQGLLLLDLKDLQSMLQYVGENAKTFTTEYGNISPASIGAIQRGLLSLENEGGASLFGEPALDLDDLMQTAADGRGVVSILAADKLMNSPKMYATFLLWLLAELFEQLPEVGDVEKPNLVFFFDEAHLLFTDAPKVLQDKIEQVVRLIRSKGVGVYFVSQNPLDIPDQVLGQLGNRVQHALRAFTPRDQKAVKAAATTFRSNPNLDVEATITELGVGEALISLLDESGRPGVVERAFVVPPGSQLGPVTVEQRQRIIRESELYGQYEQQVDRESAHEMLAERAEQMDVVEEDESPRRRSTRTSSRDADEPTPRRKSARSTASSSSHRRSAADSDSVPRQRSRREPQGTLDTIVKSASRALGSQIGKQIVRGLLGSMLGTGSRSNRR